MIRCTARSVIPTWTATCRNTRDGFRDKTTNTCVWFVRNVQWEPTVAGSERDASRGEMTRVPRLRRGGFVGKVLPERFPSDTVDFPRAFFTNRLAGVRET